MISIYFSCAISTVSAIGVFLSRKNVILTLMSLEVMMLSVTFNFLFFSTYLDDINGDLFLLFMLAVSAAESAIGLSIVISYYRLYAPEH